MPKPDDLIGLSGSTGEYDPDSYAIACYWGEWRAKIVVSHNYPTEVGEFIEMRSHEFRTARRSWPAGMVIWQYVPGGVPGQAEMDRLL